VCKKEKSLRVKYGIPVRDMNIAVRKVFELGASRLVPARQLPLPATTQRAIERHEKGLCSCAAKIAQIQSEVGPEFSGSYSVEGECAAAIKKLKVRSWNNTSPEFDPILNDFSVKLYADYANQHLKNLDDSMKARLESIEELAIEFCLSNHVCADIIKPPKGRHDPMDDPNWEWEPDALTTVTAREILGQFNANDEFDSNDATGEIKNSGYTRKGRQKPLSSFDLPIREDRGTRKLEKETDSWVREYLATKHGHGKKTYKQVEADFDKLFLAKIGV
jgi:hypothetical protein